jgi:hypothetical protein
MLGLMWAVDSGRLGAGLSPDQDAKTLDVAGALQQFKPQVADAVTTMLKSRDAVVGNARDVNNDGVAEYIEITAAPGSSGSFGAQIAAGLGKYPQAQLLANVQDVELLVGSASSTVPVRMLFVIDPQYTQTFAIKGGDYAVLQPLSAATAPVTPGVTTASAGGGNTFAILLGVLAIGALGFVFAGR